MMQITKIILILIPIIVPCDNSVTKELDIKCIKKSVLSKMYCNNLVRYVENFKLWKKRKRLTSMFDELKIRIKRRAMDYEYVLDVKSTPVARGELRSSSDILVTFKRNWPLALWRRYLFTDDYLLLINPHWLKFGPPEPAMQYLLGGLYVTMAVVGCSGNAVVIIMYFRQVYL
ncbi:unnamed protein product [Pieris macdunnoughi]|uniref:Uncharacterized protein n=1 Tax=Pieris macdunnoughi TaxID=345717 RepID=A0A821Q5T0_9NEOP|nr:unnamed protein product [Pieris macdunnoughi]